MNQYNYNFLCWVRHSRNRYVLLVSTFSFTSSVQNFLVTFRSDWHFAKGQLYTLNRSIIENPICCHILSTLLVMKWSTDSFSPPYEMNLTCPWTHSMAVKRRKPWSLRAQITLFCWIRSNKSILSGLYLYMSAFIHSFSPSEFIPNV